LFPDGHSVWLPLPGVLPLARTGGGSAGRVAASWHHSRPHPLRLPAPLPGQCPGQAWAVAHPARQDEDAAALEREGALPTWARL